MSKVKYGFARADITPPNGIHMPGYFYERLSEGCFDRLTGSCLAVSDGEKTAVVFTLDLISVTGKNSDSLRKVVSEATGLPYDAVYFCCIHTHTGPSTSSGKHGDATDSIEYYYNGVMQRLLADAAVAAINDLSDGEVYTARGEAKGLSFVRRFKMKDGSTRTNPGIKNPDIDHPIGEPDESLQLVRIVRDGKDDIVLLNFQCHPDLIGGNKISADWCGWTRRAFEGAVPNTKCLFFNGAQGDTNHICVTGEYTTPLHDYDHSRHMGISIAGEAMKLYTYAERFESERGVNFMQHNIDVPSNRGTPEQLPLAEKYIELHESGRSHEIPYSGMEHTTVIAEAYRIKRLENGPDAFTLNLNGVSFGDVAFSGIPGEPFTDIGRGIKSQSPFGMTLVCCCANGSEGYYPMQSAYDEGGYEARSSKFAAGVAERIIDGSVKMLNELHK